MMVAFYAVLLRAPVIAKTSLASVRHSAPFAVFVTPIGHSCHGRRMPMPTDATVDENGSAASTGHHAAPDWEREIDCAFDEIEAGTFADPAPAIPVRWARTGTSS
jgi:hypothetical protein